MSKQPVEAAASNSTIHVVEENGGLTVRVTGKGFHELMPHDLRRLGIPADRIKHVDCEGSLNLSAMHGLPALSTVHAESLTLGQVLFEDSGMRHANLGFTSIPSLYPSLTEIDGDFSVAHPLEFPSLRVVRGRLGVSAAVSMPALEIVKGDLWTLAPGIHFESLVYVGMNLSLNELVRAPKLIGIAGLVMFPLAGAPDDDTLKSYLPNLKFVGYNFRNGQLDLIPPGTYSDVRCAVGIEHVGRLVEHELEMQKQRHGVLDQIDAAADTDGSEQAWDSSSAAGALDL